MSFDQSFDILTELLNQKKRVDALKTPAALVLHKLPECSFEEELERELMIINQLDLILKDLEKKSKCLDTIKVPKKLENKLAQKKIKKISAVSELPLTKTSLVLSEEDNPYTNGGMTARLQELDDKIRALQPESSEEDEVVIHNLTRFECSFHLLHSFRV